MTEKKEVQLFTDGACSGNPGPGGWGAILRYKGQEKAVSYPHLTPPTKPIVKIKVLPPT